MLVRQSNGSMGKSDMLIGVGIIIFLVAFLWFGFVTWFLKIPPWKASSKIVAAFLVALTLMSYIQIVGLTGTP